jgi:hypothetical protein
MKVRGDHVLSFEPKDRNVGSLQNHPGPVGEENRSVLELNLI